MDFSWIEEVIIDALKLLPFLFLTYLLMEYIEYWSFALSHYGCCSGENMDLNCDNK